MLLSNLLEETGKNIVLLRKAAKWSQEQLAFRSNISINRLRDIEHGCQNTTISTLQWIAKAFQVDSMVLGVFLKSDEAILSAVRRLPQIPILSKEELQIYRNIALLRKAEGLTQKELARLSGISVARLRDIEHGCANTTTIKLHGIARAFGMSLLELSTITMSEDELLDIVYQARRAAGVKCVRGGEEMPGAP